MKTIQCIKKLKGYELEELRRVEDKEAEQKVKTGYFKYVPKSDWKNIYKEQLSKIETKTEEPKKVTIQSSTDGSNTSREETISEKQLKSRKREYKKAQ